MAEVGVLQLTIEDNSESAAKGLDRLADVLERVRNAVGSGLGLEGTSNEIEKIAKVVNDAISGSTITKLGQFADALKGLKGINLKSVANAMQGFDQGSAIENTKDQVNALSTEFTKARTAMNTFYTKYAEIKSLVAGTNTPLLGSGGVAPENALSTQVWTGPDWKPDRTHGENFSTGWTSDIGKVRGDAIEVEGTVTDAMEGTAQAVSGAADAISEGMTVVSGAMENAAGSTGTVTDGMVEVEASVEDATGSAHRFADALDFIKTKAKGAWSALTETRDGVNGLKGAFSAMFPTLSTFLSGMGRIVKYRLIRTIIKQITSGMSEGIQNVYHYSKAIGSSFAPAMDSAAAALLQMKNSVGAALAPAIQSLIPYLEIVVRWFITLINYANQFISLLRGQQTWTRAVPKTTQAFDDQTKAAKKAGAAIKDLLADWDELNIIQSESGGGGGGTGTGAAEDYLSMFEEVGKYEGWIKNLVDGINEQFGDIWGLVKRIGLAILGWKFSRSFTGVLGKLSALTAAGEVIAISWKLTEMFDEQFLETHDDGWLVADALTNLVGATLAGGIVQTVLGGAAGVITAGIELAVSGGISYGIGLANEEEDEANALKDLGLIKGVIGDILLAAGFGIAAGPAGIVFGAAAGAAMFTVSAAVSVVIEQFETAQEIAAKAFSETGEGGISVDEIFTELQTKFDEKAKAFSLSINAFSNVPTLKTDLAEAYKTIQNMTGLVKSKDSLTQEEAEKFKNAWSTVFSAFEGITADSFATVFEGLNASLSSEISEIRERSKELRIELLKANQGMSEAQATFRVNMEDLEGKIQTGTASKDDLELYFKYLEEVSKMSGTTVTALDEVINESAKIDFGDAEHGLENMTSFIQKASEAAKTDIDTIDEGLKANLDALQTLRDEVEMYHNLGIIKDEDYNIYKGVFDEAEETIKDEANRRKRSISDTLIETYKSILSQAMSGLDEFKGEDGKVDYLAAHTYMHTYIAPILKALQDAGAEIDEEMAKRLGIGYSLQESGWLQTMWGTFLSFDPESGVELPESSTFAWLKKYYGDTADLVGEVISGETVTGEMDAEILVNEPNVELSDWSISEAIYDAIWDAADAGSLSADLLFELSDKYGLDLQGVLDNMQVEYQMDDTVKQIQTIIDEINKTSGLELHLPEVKDEQSAKKTDEAARNYEDMANRIRAAFKSMDGLGFSFSVEGMNGTVGITMPAIPAAASGAVFKSGDIFSANENGKTELIGSYGNKTAVMNNDQVVGAVTNGVAQANSGVEERLAAIENRLIEVIRKGLSARVTPDSGWSRHAQASENQYSRVTG